MDTDIEMGETVVDMKNEKDRDRVIEMALQIVREEHPPPSPPEEETNTTVTSSSLSGIRTTPEPSSSSRRHPHRYKCCCCEMDGPVINYTGKLTIGMSVLFFCFVQIHRSSDDFAAYMTLISAVLGVFISTPKMKRSREEN